MKKTGKYLIILLAILVLWNTPVIKPLKIFTVFLHELGHALMAAVFGKGISAFNVNFNESGNVIAQTKGWLGSFMVANGGYLGSVVFALLILYLKKTVFKKYILGTLAIILLGVSVKFSGLSFTLLFSICFAAFVLVLYMAQNEKINDWVLDIIGVSAVAYAIYDTFVDTILVQINLFFKVLNGWYTKQPMTDAAVLAKLTHIPALVWGIIWLGIAVFAVYATLLKAPGRNK